MELSGLHSHGGGGHVGLLGLALRLHGTLDSLQCPRSHSDPHYSGGVSGTTSVSLLPSAHAGHCCSGSAGGACLMSLTGGFEQPCCPAMLEVAVVAVLVVPVSWVSQGV